MGLEGQMYGSERSDGWFQEVGWMSLEGQLDGSKRSDGRSGSTNGLVQKDDKKFILKG